LAFLIAFSSALPSFTAPICYETGLHDAVPPVLQFVPADQWVANAFTSGPCGNILTEVGFYCASPGGTVEVAVYEGTSLIFSGIFGVPAASGWVTIATPPIPVLCGSDFILAVKPQSGGFTIGRANPPCYETYMRTCLLPTPTFTDTFTPGPTETSTPTPGPPTSTFTPGPTDTSTNTPGPTDTPEDTPTATSTPGPCEDRYWPDHTLVLGSIAPGFMATFDQMCFKAWMTSTCGGGISPTFTVVDQFGNPVAPSFTLSGPATVDVCLPFLGAYATAGPLWWIETPLCGGFDMSDFRLRNDCLGSPTPTSTDTPTRTPTRTSTFTLTRPFTNSPTFSRTPTPSWTGTASSTSTNSPTRTSTPTVTPTSTITLTPTITPTPTITFTRTATPTITETPGPYTVTLGVYNEAGELIVGLAVRQMGEPCTDLVITPSLVIDRFQGAGSSVSILCGNVDMGTWDGTNAQGDPVSNGNYFLKVGTVDPFGSTTGVTRTVSVRRATELREVRVLNSAGEVVRHLYDQVGDPTGDLLTGLELDSPVFQPGTGDLGIVLSTSGGAVTLAWDGRTDGGILASPGYYFISAHWADGQGSVQDMGQGAVLTGGKEAWQAIAQPNLLRPGSGNDTASFSVVSGTDWTVRVVIHTVTGEKVADSTGATGSNLVQWKAMGVASGLYFARVEAKDPSGSIHRTTLKLVVLH
jgi:hypothetical protein